MTRRQTDVSRLVNGERLALLGWSRAILLQMAHPLIAAGVHEHSGFRKSPTTALGRLRATANAMLAITFGDDERRERALAGIRAIHTRVHGTLPTAVGPFDAGTPYSAEAPELLLWVHVTLIESTLLTYQTFIGDLTDDLRDEYCRLSAPPAIALGARRDDMPVTWCGVTAAVQRGLDSDAITVGDQAREIAAALMHGPVMRAMPPAGWLNRLITVGFLPPRLRAGSGFEWDDGRAKTLARVARAMRGARKLTPATLARFADARR